MKIAFIGTGGVANRHLGVLAQLPACSVVGHLSESRQRAESQSARWGGRAYVDVAELVERESPDAVWVCVTPDRHGTLEATLIAHGIPMFIEKPLSNDLATAERIAAQLALQPLVVGVGYKFRALDTLPRVMAMLAERAPQLAIGSWLDKTPPPLWWQDERCGAGQVVEQTTHLIDLARVLMGEPRVLAATALRRPRPGYPHFNVAQVTAALLLFPNDVPATLNATCILDAPLTIALQVVCEGRVLTITERALWIETGRHTDEVAVGVDPFLVEDQAFLEAVREANPRGVLCDYADALATHRVALAIRSAAR